MKNQLQPIANATNAVFGPPPLCRAKQISELALMLAMDVGLRQKFDALVDSFHEELPETSHAATGLISG